MNIDRVSLQHNKEYIMFIPGAQPKAGTGLINADGFCRFFNVTLLGM